MIEFEALDPDTLAHYRRGLNRVMKRRNRIEKGRR